MNKLCFAANGMILLHATRNHVSGCNIKTLQRCCECDGELIGISRDGTTILTHRDPVPRQASSLLLTRQDVEPIRAWNIVTGNEIEIQRIDPESFERYQRTFGLANYQPLTLELHDALNAGQPLIIRDIGSSAHNLGFDEWALASDNQSLRSVAMKRDMIGPRVNVLA